MSDKMRVEKTKIESARRERGEKKNEVRPKNDYDAGRCDMQMGIDVNENSMRPGQGSRTRYCDASSTKVAVSHTFGTYLPTTHPVIYHFSQAQQTNAPDMDPKGPPSGSTTHPRLHSAPVTTYNQLIIYITVHTTIRCVWQGAKISTGQ